MMCDCVYVQYISVTWNRIYFYPIPTNTQSSIPLRTLNNKCSIKYKLGWKNKTYIYIYIYIWVNCKLYP